MLTSPFGLPVPGPGADPADEMSREPSRERIRYTQEHEAERDDDPTPFHERRDLHEADQALADAHGGEEEGER